MFKITGKLTLRPEVLAFAKLMELELRKYDSARGDDWKEENLWWLRDRLDDEIIELDQALDDDGNIASEAVDVANFAMFIAYQSREV